MQLVSRAQWGARSASTSTDITPVGVAVHWEGPHMGTPAHTSCAGLVRGIQAFHMDTRGWADIAYSAVACPHGYVFEGRGRGHRTAANGTNDGNQRFYAVCFLGGEGDTFTAAAKQAINDAIAWLGGGQVVGHRDLTETACPGDEIYAWAHGSRGVPAPAPTPDPLPEPGKEDPMTFTHGVTSGKAKGQVWLWDSAGRIYTYVGDPGASDLFRAAGVPYAGDFGEGVHNYLASLAANAAFTG